MSEQRYTGDQIATAARELRDAAGAEEAFYSAKEAVEMLREEIHLLRERGFTDERIAGLLSGFDIEVTAEDIAKSPA